VNIVKLGLVPLVLFLTGCDWVDSTGKQPDSSPSLSDPELIIVDDRDAFAVLEKTEHTIVFSNDDSRIRDWNWTLLEAQADTENCADFDGFEKAIATNVIADSCAKGDNCEINVTEKFTNNVTQFRITAPDLQRPAALRFRVTAETDDGAFIQRRQTVCALSINEAPTAVDDPISIVQGSTLIVDGDDSKSLLDNDYDDIDVRNETLKVNRVAVQKPRFASQFELFEDGGFIYEPDDQAPVSKNGAISDRFIYAITDGTHVSTATASIKVTEFNSAPTQTAQLPTLTFVVDDTSSTPTLSMRNYFTDAENNPLKFTVKNDSLPVSGNISLSETGLLTGFAEGRDSGLYEVTVNVSDSIESVDASFLLYVVREGVRNKAPYVTDIDNETVRNEFEYDVSVFFGDSEDDHLYFTAIDLPTGVIITSKGVIKGKASARNRGRWLIRVTADDGNGGTTDDGFRLRIQ